MMIAHFSKSIVGLLGNIKSIRRKQCLILVLMVLYASIVGSIVGLLCYYPFLWIGRSSKLANFSFIVFALLGLVMGVIHGYNLARHVK